MLVSAAQAQGTSAGAAQAVDEGLRRQAERERHLQQAEAPQASSLRPAVRAALLPELPDEQPCFVIHEVVLLGPGAGRFGWLGTSVAPLLGRCIGVQGLGRITAFLDAQLLEQGYVTSRVSLGPQNVATGRLELRLHAGRIERVEMVDADAPDRAADTRWGTWRNAFPTREGALLDARDLEQGVEQMKRLPSQSVTSTLAPGVAPDTTVVTIERHAGGWSERLRGGVVLDNGGSPALGRTQAALNVALDNPLGLNDLLALSANSNAEHPDGDHRSQGWGLQYSLPLGYSTLSASAGHSRFAQTVHLPTLPHLSSGRADTAELRLQHVAWRTASSKTGLYAALSTRRSSSFLDDTELLSQRRRTTFWDTGLSFRQLYAGNASLELELGHRHGVSWLQAQDDLPRDPHDPAGIPTLRPRLWTLNAGVSWPLQQAGGRPLLYSATLRAQATHDRMLSIDQMAIGGRYSVRGFDGDSVLIAENGWVLRNELSAALPPLEGVDGSLYLGLDAGRVWGASDPGLPGHRLAGTALGLRTRFKALQFDIALATPLAKPQGFSTARWNLYASASQAF
jgi:hemolysin activation/secretion protein